MRLLDVDSISKDQLPIFRGLFENGTDSPLRYAILSHTWGKRQDNKDIIFDDIPSSETFARFFDEATQLKQWQIAVEKKKIGFSKVFKACRLAREMGLDHIWIDSCCIDKSKSAELNESINSMFRWYQNSEMCIVYLEDLEPSGELSQCRWFKRGWTLQELIAPSKVLFYDKTWNLLGERSHATLCEAVSEITGIDTGCLQGRVNLGALSIAHKMSWADERETSVAEDRAYSLMGIFDVNMPLIYGEGVSKAFQRLQEEIAKVCSDLSIFSWDSNPQANALLGAFASSPNDFRGFKYVVPSYHSQHFTKTNKGIEMKTVLWRTSCDDGKERLMLPIVKQKNGKHNIGIILRKVGHNMYIRRGKMYAFSDEMLTRPVRTSTFYIFSPQVSPAYDHFLNTSREHAIWLPADGLGDFHIVSEAPEYAWDCEDRLFFNNRHWGWSDWRAIRVARATSAAEPEQQFLVLFSLNEGTPDCFLLKWSEDLGLIFDRRHQTERTRLKDFQSQILEGATNELELDTNGMKLSTLLVLISMEGNSGSRFRVDLKEVPQHKSDLTISVKKGSNKEGKSEHQVNDDLSYPVTLLPSPSDRRAAPNEYDPNSSCVLGQELSTSRLFHDAPQNRPSEGIAYFDFPVDELLSSVTYATWIDDSIKADRLP